MKRFYSRFRILLMTFAFGLASAGFFDWLNVYLNEVRVDLPKTKSKSPIPLLIIDRDIGNKNVFDLKDAGAFTFAGRGCGGKNKYGGESTGTGYTAYNWQRLGMNTSWHENSKNAERELNLRIEQATRILESEYVFNKNSKSKEWRIILESTDEEKKIVQLVTYDGKHRIIEISAPSLQLIYEFEKWQEYHSNLIKDIK